MTTPSQFPGGLDPVHIARICAIAGRTEPRNDGVLLAGGGRYPVRVFMPTRAQARAAQAALRRIGYATERRSRPGHGRDLIIRGWSNELLDARLAAMRTVVGALRADVTATVARTINRLGQLPASALPGQAGQLELARQAGQELYARTARICGLDTRPDPRARPADAGTVLRLHAADHGRAEITALIAWHVSMTTDALGAYMRLRATAGHQEARAAAIRTIRGPFPDSGTRNVARSSAPGRGEVVVPGLGTASANRPQRLRNAEPTQIFPADGLTAGSLVFPPRADRPPGRGFPAGPRL